MKKLNGQIALNLNDITIKTKKKLEKEECGTIIKSKRKGGNLDKSIIGKVFGRLTVLKFDYSIILPISKRCTYWICKCKCGTIKTIRRQCLIQGGTKSCGCLYKESVKRPKNRRALNFKDLTGKKFNQLLVVKELYIDKNKQVIWECLCDCGNKTTCSSAILNFGSQKSCGCAKRKSNLEDLIGQTFGCFTVLERIHRKIKGGGVRGIWKCQCNCGTIRYIRNSQLKRAKLISCQNCRNYYGENNGNWNSNLSDNERNSQRHHDPKLRKWRKDVYKRDDYTCQITGVNRSKEQQICAHHLESWHLNKKSRYRLTNGIVMLESLHIYFHQLYGIKNNTKKQFQEFVKNLTKSKIKYLIKKNKKYAKRRKSRFINKISDP